MCKQIPLSMSRLSRKFRSCCHFGHWPIVRPPVSWGTGLEEIRLSSCGEVRLPSGELDNRQSQSRCFCTEVQWQACNWVLSTNQVLIHCTGLEYLTTSCQNNYPPSSNQQIDFFHQAGFRGGGSSVQVQFVVKCAIFSLHSKSRLVQGGREESRGAKHAGSKWF